MSLLSAVEEKVRAVVEYVDGEAIKIAKEAEAAALDELHAVEADVASLGPLATEVKAALETAAAAVGPELKAAAEKLIQAVESLTGEAPSGM